MGAIKNRNGMDLTETENIKKKWQEYTEELYKKDLRDPDDHEYVITHLEPDILECEVKWARTDSPGETPEIPEDPCLHWRGILRFRHRLHTRS